MPSLQPVGTAIKLNVSAGGAATLVPLSGGGFGAIYKVRGGPDVLRLFDGNYNATSNEIVLTNSDINTPTATALSDGRVLVSWLQGDQTIHGAIWNANGTQSVASFQIAAASDASVGLSKARIISIGSGWSVAFWQDNGTLNGVTQPVLFQPIDSNGVMVNQPTRVTPPSVPGASQVLINDFQATVLPNGNQVIAAQVVADGVTSIWYSVNGSAFTMLAGGDANFNYVNPQVAALAGNSFVITYDFVNPGSVGTSNPDSNWTTGGTVFTDHGTHHDFAIGTTITTTRNGDFSVNPSVITALPDGGFVVSFEPVTSPLDTLNGGYLIDAQRFDQFGAALGPVVLTTAAGFAPTLTTATDGAVLSSYQIGGDIYLQAYQPFGYSWNGIEPTSSSFGFNSVVSANSPGVSVLSNGGFVVVYQGYGDNFFDGFFDNSRKAYAQLYDANHNPVGAEFRLSSNAQQPVVAAQADGTFMVIWTNGSQIRAAHYNNDGSKIGSTFTMVQNTAHPLVNPGIVATTNGGYLIAYETDLQDVTGSHQLTIQQFSASGTAIGQALSQTYAPTNPLTPPRITALENLLFGTAAVLGQGNQIYVNIYSGALTATGSAGVAGETLAPSNGFTSAATITGSSQFLVSGDAADGILREDAQIVSLTNGDLAVVWDELRTGEAVWRVSGQLVSPVTGQPDGVPFSVVTSLPATSASGQLALTALPDGGFLVTYDSGNGQLASQRYDATGATVGEATLITTTAATGAATALMADGSVLVISTAANQTGTAQITGQSFAIAAPPVAWTGTASGDLATVANWNGGVLPSLTQQMAFSLANGGTLTGSGSAASGAFIGGGNWLLNNGTLGFVNGLSEQANLTVNGGQVTGGGALTVGDGANATMTVLNGGTVHVNNVSLGLNNGAGTIDLEGAGTALIIDGALAINSGRLILGQGSKLTLANGLTESGTAGIVFNGGVFDPGAAVTNGFNTVSLSSLFENLQYLTNNGTYDINAGATLTVNTPVINGTGGTFVIGANNAGLVLNTGSVGSGQTIAFTDATGTLVLGADPGTGNVAANAFSAFINGFQAGDKLIVNHPSVVSTAVSGSNLNLYGAGGTLLGALSFTSAAGATAASTAVTVQCFAAGTRLATTRGPMAVEHLRPGDMLSTLIGGDTGEVIWVGYRTVDCRRHPDPVKVWPILVSAHAFGAGMPATDLMLSPDHSIYVDRVLIPVRLLVNGRTVRQIPVDRITYHHVELDRHDVVLAEGLPAESYLDTGDRDRFTNGGEVVALYPDFSARAWEMNGCAPLVQTGPVLEKVRRRLAQRIRRRRGVVAYTRRFTDQAASVPEPMDGTLV